MTSCYQYSYSQQLCITSYKLNVNCFHYAFNIIIIPDCLSVFMWGGEKRLCKVNGSGCKSTNVFHLPQINEVWLTLCWRYRKIRENTYTSDLKNIYAHSRCEKNECECVKDLTKKTKQKITKRSLQPPFVVIKQILTSECNYVHSWKATFEEFITYFMGEKIKHRLKKKINGNVEDTMG